MYTCVYISVDSLGFLIKHDYGFVEDSSLIFANNNVAITTALMHAHIHIQSYEMVVCVESGMLAFSWNKSVQNGNLAVAHNFNGKNRIMFTS